MACCIAQPCRQRLLDAVQQNPLCTLHLGAASQAANSRASRKADVLIGAMAPGRRIARADGRQLLLALLRNIAYRFHRLSAADFDGEAWIATVSPPISGPRPILSAIPSGKPSASTWSRSPPGSSRRKLGRPSRRTDQRQRLMSQFSRWNGTLASLLGVGQRHDLWPLYAGDGRSTGRTAAIPC